jgi:hypothetical protein
MVKKMGFSKEVNLKPIDADRLKIEKSNEFNEAYAVEIELDSTPDSIWTWYFNMEYYKNLDLMKRQVVITGDKLRIAASPNDIKENIEWIKDLVRITNEKVRMYTKELDKTQKEQRMKERESIQKMRDLLKNK